MSTEGVDVVAMLQQCSTSRNATHQPAQELIRALIDDDIPQELDGTAARTKMLISLLNLLLASHQFPQKKQRIRQFAYSVKTSTLRKMSKSIQVPGVAVLLCPRMQDWLQEQLTLDIDELDNAAVSNQLATILGARVEKFNVSPGEGQKARQQAKKRLKNARQHLDWDTFQVSWVVREDVAQDLRQRRGYTGPDLDRAVDKVWLHDCFPLDLRVVDGQQVTEAEAISLWLQKGYSRKQCTCYFRPFPEVADRKGARRIVEEDWAAQTTKRLKAQLQSPFSDASSSRQGK